MKTGLHAGILAVFLLYSGLCQGVELSQDGKKLFSKMLGTDNSGLDKNIRERLLEYFNKIRGYRRCKSTIAKCLSKKEPSRAVRRFAGFIANLVKSGADDQKIEDWVILRNHTLYSGPVKKINLSGYVPMGGGKKVTIVVYADFECPFCGALAPQLARLARDMKDNVSVYFKPWPIRGHPNGLAAAKALMAAGRQGRFWEMHRVLFKNQKELDYKHLLEYARQTGCDMDRFRKDFADKAIRKMIEKSKREGISLGVDATPSIFMNGRRYYLDYSYEGLRDAAEELVDTV